MFENLGMPIGWGVLYLGAIYCIALNAVMNYANRYGRDRTSWVFIAILFTPFIAAFLLFLYGESKEHRKERIIKEELWRRSCNEEVMKIKEVVENKVSKEKDMSDPLNW